MLDSHTRKYLTEFKLFVVRIVTWSYYCLPRIIIGYLKPYNYSQIIGPR